MKNQFHAPTFQETRGQEERRQSLSGGGLGWTSDENSLAKVGTDSRERRYPRVFVCINIIVRFQKTANRGVFAQVETCFRQREFGFPRAAVNRLPRAPRI